MRASRIPLPAPLRSTPVTALRGYSGRSDSCAGGSLALQSMNTVLRPTQVSLRPAPCRPGHSVSNHPTCPDRAFARYPSARVGFPRLRRLRFRLCPSRLITHVRPNRVRFLRTGQSPSIAPHLASRRRSYRWVRAGERLPGEDFHLSVMAPLQARSGPALRAGRLRPACPTAAPIRDDPRLVMSWHARRLAPTSAGTSPPAHDDPGLDALSRYVGS